jgi:PAS domain S-box-containing protein
VSNDPATDPRRGGIPRGHPEIKCFLGLPFHFEGKLVGAAALANRRDGYQTDLVEYLQPFISACANIIQAYRTHREHRKTEESLRKSAERYDQIFTKNKSVKLLVDSEGIIVDANPSAAEFYGYSQEELIGMHIGQINISPSEKISEAIRNVHAEVKMSFVFQHKLRSGEVRDVEVSSTPIEIGSRKLIYSIVTDITKRKKAEAELKESEERFQAIFNAATDFIYTKDVHGRFVDVNPAIETFTGLKASQIRGRKTEDIFGEELARAGRESESRVLQGESVEKELTFSVKGFGITLTCCMMPLRDAEGNITGVLGIARDITDRRRLEIRSNVPETYISEAMRLTLKQAEMAAKGNATILLLGESGTGKDYLARHIHNRSGRAGGPYFAVNCAAIAPELAESELFGHEKGAFTGAIVRKRGLLELAEGGTLLLNEIGELSPPLQAKLLTFLDTRKFTRVGGEKEITVNARLIAATNRDLENEIRERRFRQDLFYRLSVMTIKVPPLRERKDDIPFLVRELLSQLVSELQLPHMPAIEPKIVHALKRYDWPGNVRELRNVLERSLILSHGQELRLAGLGFGEEPEESLKATFTASFPSEQSINEVTHELKRFFIAEALKRSGGNRQGAAKMLGISRYSLKHYMKSLGFHEDESD